MRTCHGNEEVEQVVLPSDSNNTTLRLIAEPLLDDEKITSYSNNYDVLLAVRYISYTNGLPITSKKDEAIGIK